MAGWLVLLLIVAIGVACLAGRAFARRRARRSATILAAVALAGALTAGCNAAREAPSGASSPETSPCAAAEPDPACDAAERARYLAELADQQIRTMPVLVKWRDHLPWGQQTSITAIIASADRASAEAALDTAATRSGGQIEERSVAIGRRVRAELTGLNVEIDKPEQTVRDVTALQNVTFEWLVRPTRPGKTVLTLRIFNELITPDGPIELERPALVHEMPVKIGVLDWLTWQMEQTRGLFWLIGGLLTGLGLLFANQAKLRRWWRRRHPPAPPSPP